MRGLRRAPEVYRQEPYTEKVDVFSFGVILFEVRRRVDQQLGAPKYVH